MSNQPYRDELPLGMQIGCGDCGSGPPLVLLHCSGGDRHHWTRFCNAWRAEAGSTHRFVTPELFGCGETDRWPGAQATLQDYAALVGSLLARFPAPVDLVGHSFGGAVALHLAREKPEQIRSLTLIEPAAFFILKGQSDLEARLLREFEAIGAIVRHGTALGTPESRQAAMNGFVDYWNGAGKWDALPASARIAMSGMIDAVRQDIDAALTETSRLDDYRDVTTPALLLYGEKSPEPARHMVGMLARAMRNAKAACLKDAGHMTPLSHPVELVRLIVAHCLTSA